MKQFEIRKYNYIFQLFTQFLKINQVIEILQNKWNKNICFSFYILINKRDTLLIFYYNIYITSNNKMSMLTNNPTQMDSYNKYAKPTQGTLMANWFQQRVHREDKGNGRASTKTHFPKKHDQLLDSEEGKSRSGEDDTKYRVLGDTNYGLPTSQNYHYGKSKNKADTFAKVGRRQQLSEEQYLKQITEELEAQQRKKFEQQRKGHFETTNKATYVPKPLDANQVGRLVMRDQSGGLVGLDRVDEDLRQTNGFRERGQISTDEELRRICDSDNGYERSVPITYWREKMEDGNYYMSKPGAQQSFGKNNQFLKTFKHYKHYRD